MTGPWVGVDVGGTNLQCVARWPDHRPHDTLRLATGSDCYLEELEHYIARFIGSLDATPQGIGIAIPGLVREGQVIDSDVLPHLKGWKPGSAADIDVSTLMLNDVRAALESEMADAPDDATIVVIVCGTGIGMAFAAEGRAVEGADGWAGELGSIPMLTGTGVLTLDGIASGAAITQRCTQDPDSIHTALDAGNQEVSDVVSAAAEAFGLAIASVIDIINPSIVSIAGGTLTYRGYVDTALSTAAMHTLPQLWEKCTIRNRASEPLLVALGAARAVEITTGNGR